MEADGSERAEVDADDQRAIRRAAKGIRINAVCPGTIETPMVTDITDRAARPGR
jgi:NAD(P)-dependent dehydrogenase (short-subunit alcohol dehydrogenase family)